MNGYTDFTTNDVFMPYMPVNKGIDERRASVPLNIEKYPTDFPKKQWDDAQKTYNHFWKWQTGEVLAEMSKAKAEGASELPMYPLAMNFIRNLSYKMALLLVGESPDTSAQLIRTVVRPKVMGDDATDEEKAIADDMQFAIEEAWTNSYGRSITLDNAILSQFLGGCVFQVTWDPTLEDSLVPIKIKNILPDFFLPIWANDDYWNLEEAYIVYKISEQEAKKRYKQDAKDPVYIERWTKTDVKVYIGEKLVDTRENPFGFVPFVYIPRVRVGNFHGVSLITDIEQVVLEYNSKVADMGDAVKEATHRVELGLNINGDIPLVSYGAGDRAYYDLGETIPNMPDKKPELVALPPMPIAEAGNKHLENLYVLMQRLAFSSPIVDGEDKTAQRSAITMAMKFYPSTSHIEAQRIYWDIGMNMIAKMIIKMMVVKANDLLLADFPRKFEKGVLRRYAFSQMWNPKIPKDEETKLNKVILTHQGGLLSTESAIEILGDVADVQEEIKRIRKDLEYTASLTMKSGAGDPNAQAETQSSDVKTDITTPVVTDGASPE